MNRRGALSLLILILMFISNVPGFSSEQGMSETNDMTNLQIIKKIYDGFEFGDMEAILKDMSEDVTWLHPGNSEQIPFAGKFQGKAGVKRFFETAFEQIDVLEQKIKSFVEGEDKVIVIGYEHMKVKKTGLEYKSNWVHLYTLADGKVVEFEEFIDTAELVVAFNSD